MDRRPSSARRVELRPASAPAEFRASSTMPLATALRFAESSQHTDCRAPTSPRPRQETGSQLSSRLSLLHPRCHAAAAETDGPPRGLPTLLLRDWRCRVTYFLIPPPRRSLC